MKNLSHCSPQLKPEYDNVYIYFVTSLGLHLLQIQIMYNRDTIIIAIEIGLVSQEGTVTKQCGPAN